MGLQPDCCAVHVLSRLKLGPDGIVWGDFLACDEKRDLDVVAWREFARDLRVRVRLGAHVCDIASISLPHQVAARGKSAQRRSPHAEVAQRSARRTSLLRPRSLRAA